jgi:hypothetical protein
MGLVYSHHVSVMVIVNVDVFRMSVIGYIINRIRLFFAILPKMNYSQLRSYRDTSRH